MSEWWTSQARKWCKYCECWITDNQSSITYHENGKKHKERIQELLKRVRIDGNAKEKETSAHDAMMAQINAAAEGAYKKDVDAGHAIASSASVASTSTPPMPPMPPEPSPPPPPADARGTGKAGGKGKGGGGGGVSACAGGKGSATDKPARKDPPTATPAPPPVTIDENTGMSLWQPVAVPIKPMYTKPKAKQPPKDRDKETKNEPSRVEQEPIQFHEKKLEAGLKRNRGEKAGPVAFKKRKRPAGK